MPTLKKLIPDANLVKSLHPAELAGYILEVLMSPDSRESGSWNRRNFCMQAMQEYDSRDAPRDHEIGVSCSAAWSWLQSNGLICDQPEQGDGWSVSTQRGRAIHDRQRLQSLIASERLPEDSVHPVLLLNVRPLFLQGRLETAVFEAFKALEVAIRSAAGLGHEWIGTKLASRAFHPEDGPLTDLSSEGGERTALMNLMSGAIGSYKNPTSHRKVELSTGEARDMIVIASHLMKIVDSRDPLCK